MLSSGEDFEIIVWNLNDLLSAAIRLNTTVMVGDTAPIEASEYSWLHGWIAMDYNNTANKSAQAGGCDLSIEKSNRYN